ncbi:alpha/beta hydrolase [Leucobacter iarius]|uniref:Alpha/beta hydrolase-fold protein n=1 Tax=Leucobacter iarius TaxID=333963 RepID=A0ABN2L9R9_9MICO
MDWLLKHPLTSPRVMLAAAIVMGVFALYLLIRPTWKRTLLSIIGAVVGGGIGALVFWWVVDAQNIFGVDLSQVVRLWTIIGFAGLGLAIVNLFKSRWWRKMIAIIAIPAMLATSAVGINADFGAYQTLNEVIGGVKYAQLKDTTGQRGDVVKGMVDYSKWRAPADLPKQGQIGQVPIPGAVSHFKARPAVIYLPPAALVKNPPVLPVLIALSGQPGSPGTPFSSGALGRTLDQYAAAHNGLAPIVISPDQLTDPAVNPMCVDSKKFGNSETYLTRDVTDWVKANYRVSSDPRMWAVTGFSQGGTCTTQLVAKFPQLYGSGVSVQGQIGPILNNVPNTIAEGFDGSKAAYEAAQPLAIMQAKAPYRDTMMIYGVGTTDHKYTKYAHELNRASVAAGMDSRLMAEPTGHDWRTVTSVFEQAVPILAKRMGLDAG